MIEFQCKECKCNVSTFDDHLGERVCDDCGLVYITNPFEETIRIVTENYHPNKGYKFARGVDNDGRLIINVQPCQLVARSNKLRGTSKVEQRYTSSPLYPYLN